MHDKKTTDYNNYDLMYYSDEFLEVILANNKVTERRDFNFYEISILTQSHMTWTSLGQIARGSA